MKRENMRCDTNEYSLNCRQVFIYLFVWLTGGIPIHYHQSFNKYMHCQIAKR